MTSKTSGCCSHDTDGERQFRPGPASREFRPWTRLMPLNRSCSGASPSGLTEPLSVDLYRGEGSLLVVAEVPGFSREELDIDISGEILRIEGRRRAGSGDAGGSCSVRIRECIPGGFVRCVELPEAVDADSASATLDRGLLSVLLPLAGAGCSSPEPPE